MPNESLHLTGPARRKFLKGMGTETGHASEVFTRLALAQLNVHLTLRHNGKLLYEVPASLGLIAVLGEAYQVPIAPHCTASMLGIAASLHVACSVPLFLIHEFYPDSMGFNPKGLVKMPYAVDKDGHATLPPGPGLGVEIDEKALAQAAKKPQTYKWPGAKLKDGSIADY
jgi:hypothetical protein